MTAVALGILFFCVAVLTVVGLMFLAGVLVVLGEAIKEWFGDA